MLFHHIIYILVCAIIGCCLGGVVGKPDKKQETVFWIVLYLINFFTWLWIVI